MLVSDSIYLSLADKGTSKIIDASYDANYAFWDVSAGFCMHSFYRDFFSLQSKMHFAGFHLYLFESMEVG
jgi:hypothetical protein